MISCRRSLCSSTSCLNRKNHSGHNKALLNSTSFLSFFKLLQHKKKSYNAIKRAACSTVRKGTRYNKNLRWWFTRQHLFQLVSQRFNKWRVPCLKKICQRFFFLPGSRKRKPFKSGTRLSITYLPGQEVSLQLFACLYSPVQFWPPSAGTGLEQVLLLDCDPVPHVLLHVVQVDQRLNPPFTKIETVLNLTEFSGARSARSVVLWVRKFGYLCIQEIWFWQNRPYGRPPHHV